MPSGWHVPFALDSELQTYTAMFKKKQKQARNKQASSPQSLLLDMTHTRTGVSEKKGEGIPAGTAYNLFIFS